MMSSKSLNLSLQSWLTEVVSSVSDIQNTEEDLDEYLPAEVLRQRLRAVSVMAFSLPEDATTEQVNQTIREIFGEEIAEKASVSLFALAEVCLVYAISEASAERTFFVRTIMSMEQRHQANLMEAIKQNLQNLIPREEVTSDSSGLSNTVTLDAPCRSCAERNDFISQLQRDIAEITCREQILENKLKSELAVVMNRLVDAEVQIIESDKVAHAASKLSAEATARAQDLELQLKAQKDKCLMLESLQDEVDVLRPALQRADANEKQVLRLREKLEEMTDVKQQLKSEYAAHEATHSKLLLAEQELESTRKFKSQVEEYRLQLAESSIVVQDLTLRNQMHETELSECRAMIRMLESGSKGQLEQAQQLAGELMATTEQLRHVERTGGIGDGFCEMNSALMQELNKLRTENATLQERIEASSIESLNELERSLADQKCINSSLQQKWMSTTDALNKANTKIVGLERDLMLVNMLCHNMKQEHVECSRMAEEDSLATRCRHLEAVQRLNQRNDSAHRIMQIGRETLLNEFTSSLENIQAKHEAAVNLGQQLQDQVIALEITRDALNATVEEEVQARMQADRVAKQAMVQLEKQHEQEVEAEREKERALTLMLEEEKIKRRRVEREKKVVEADILRCKTQLQMTCSGGGQEVETALKEMKAMQQQLDDAQAEISALRAAGHHPTAAQDEAAPSATTARNVVSRSSRVKVSDRMDSGGGFGSTGYGFIEQTEYSDKKVDQLLKERREMVARTLEESKEKFETGQKLMQCENEVLVLKGKLTKMTLEKARAERQLAKYLAQAEGIENSAPGQVIL